jgi:NADH:ubiquinone oxidoreductase subunit F (NADH-binding)
LKQSCIQCIHCHYGCQNTYKIFDHLTNQHASKVPMYCDRIQSSGSVN